MVVILLVHAKTIVKRSLVEFSTEGGIRMKKTLSVILVLSIIIIMCSCTSKNTESNVTSGNTSNNDTAEPGQVPSLPLRFASFDELIAAIENKDTVENDAMYRNLDNLDFILVLGKTPLELKVSNIIVSWGAAGVYYAIDNPDETLIEKFKSSDAFRATDAILMLTSVKVITYRNVKAYGEKPSIVGADYKEYMAEGRSYYAAEIIYSDTLVGWEIAWVQDGLELCVGIPVSLGIEEGLKYCNVVKYIFE